MFAGSNFYFRLQLPLIIIHITCISLSLRRTSAPIHLASVLGVLGTQETSCILIAGLLERDTFDLFLPEFDKPWVIHLRETCWCSTNICTWRPNTVYKNRSVRRHHCVGSSGPSCATISFSPHVCPRTPPTASWSATLFPLMLINRRCCRRLHARVFGVCPPKIVVTLETSASAPLWPQFQGVGEGFKAVVLEDWLGWYYLACSCWVKIAYFL
jgi:hypothetical protein